MNTLNLDIQNTTDNIHRLAAQKELYNIGKKIFLLQFILTVPVTIALSLTKVLLTIFFHIDIAWLPGVYGLVLTIFDLTVIQGAISNRRTEAAKIQEAFDTSVFDLPWNKFVAGKKPEIEVINKYFRKLERRDKTGDIINKLYNWYPQEVAQTTVLKAILICQKSSINYDFSLRERFKKIIFISASITFLLLIAFALIENLSIRPAFVQVILPFLPVLTLTIKQHQEHSKSNKNLQELKSYLDEHIQSTGMEDNLSVEVIRNIQNRIYMNRRDSPLIPERLYNKLRNSLEKEMHDNAASLT